MRRKLGQCVAYLLAGVLCALPAGCNNPYPEEEEGAKVLYDSFADDPLHLDPSITYGAWLQAQVIEPLFQYHLLRRPYELVPLTATAMPRAQTRTITYQGKEREVTYYVIEVRKGIYYQNHPCFVEANRRLTEEDVEDVESVYDIKPMASRELTAGDYVFQIRRLPDPREEHSCPVYTTMAQKLLGMEDYREHLQAQIDRLRAERKKAAGLFYNQERDERYNPLPVDFAEGAEAFPFVKQLDRYRFEIVLSTPYPQILYWMAMAFFAPTPPEAIEFFHQPVLVERGMTFDRNLVGTGPFILTKMDPTNEIVMERNPNYREEYYPKLPRPDESDAQALAYWKKLKAAGMLDDAGKRLPMIDKWVLRREKEASPRWQKFKQGYYDTSTISSDTFDQAVQLSSQGDTQLTDDLKSRGIRMTTFYKPIISWYAFNMNDEVYGGLSESAKKLRQAISIAYDSEEYIAIFKNGRGKPAMGPLAPGIFGYEEGRAGMNEVVYEWDEAAGKPRRRSVEYARKLMAEAGYPGGFGPDGKQLTLTLLCRSSEPGSESELNFLRKQLDKLNIRLLLDPCDSAHFHEKAYNSIFQFIRWGWLNDYPDPENFFFLLYGPNARDVDGNNNGANYHNEEFDKLFREMETMPNSPERLAIIRKMLKIVRTDAPWIFRMNPADYSLYHSWNHNVIPHGVAANLIKYRRIDPVARATYRRKYNQPRIWPAIVLLGALLLFSVPAVWIARRHLREV